MRKITLYASPFSPYYNMAKEFLNQKGLAYDVVVDEDENKFEAVTGQKGELQFLVQEIDANNNVTGQEVIIGLDQERLAELLG